MKIGRFLNGLVKTAASVIASKQLLDTASSGPSIVEGSTPLEPRILQGPYRSADARTPPTCTSCDKVVVLWCSLCGTPIELGERVFCPKETDAIMHGAAMRAGWSAEIVGVDKAAASSLYRLAAPQEHVHRHCAFVHTTQLFTHAITDLTKD